MGVAHHFNPHSKRNPTRQIIHTRLYQNHFDPILHTEPIPIAQFLAGSAYLAYTKSGIVFKNLIWARVICDTTLFHPDYENIL